jgi:hypothetical protein
MFIGHYAVGLAAKRAAPRTSMGTLVLAAALPDLLVWALVIVGVEHIAIKPGITTTNPLDLYDYPISHSLLMDVVCGVLFAGGYYLVVKYSRGALLIFAAVLSHWVLDFVSHRPDMPLAPGVYTYYGLGLFNSRPGMILVEGFIWLVGIVIYVRTPRARKRLGTYVFWIGAALLTWIWFNSLRGLVPPGGSIVQIGVASLVFTLLVVAWAYWADHLRNAAYSKGNAASRAHQAG